MRERKLAKFANLGETYLLHYKELTNLRLGASRGPRRKMYESYCCLITLQRFMLFKLAQYHCTDMQYDLTKKINSLL